MLNNSKLIFKENKGTAHNSVNIKHYLFSTYEIHRRARMLILQSPINDYRLPTVSTEFRFPITDRGKQPEVCRLPLLPLPPKLTETAIYPKRTIKLWNIRKGSLSIPSRAP